MRPPDAAETVSEAKLRENRKEHVRLCPKRHTFTDKKGKQHSFAVGAVTIDGNGEKRAYGHIITGDEHATACLSLVTGKTLFVWHDQILCIHCQRRLTELINDPRNKKRVQELDASNLAYPGKPCY